MNEKNTSPDTWVRLLDVQGGIREDAAKPPGQKGRPRYPFPRKDFHLSMTSNSLELLDNVKRQLSVGMKRKVSRAQMISFMVFHLRDELEKLEIDLEQIRSFRELEEALRKERK